MNYRKLILRTLPLSAAAVLLRGFGYAPTTHPDTGRFQPREWAHPDPETKPQRVKVSVRPHWPHQTRIVEA